MIVGWGHTITKKYYGDMPERSCPHCDKITKWQIMRIISWYDVFFIPVCPWETKYWLLCPICEHGVNITKRESERIRYELRLDTYTSKQKRWVARHPVWIFMFAVSAILLTCQLFEALPTVWFLYLIGWLTYGRHERW